MENKSSPSNSGETSVKSEQPGSDASRREHPEPVSGNASPPHWLIVLCIALWLSSGAFLFDALSNTSQIEPRDESSAQPIGQKTLGKRVFAQNCSACHQPTGLGIPRLFPPLTGSEWVLGSDGIGDNHLVTILLHGLQGPIEVGGKSFNNSMPPWNHLSDEQIAAVLTHIRSEWGNSSTSIPAEFVKTIREKTAGRLNPWSQKELRATPAIMIPRIAPDDLNTESPSQK